MYSGCVIRLSNASMAFLAGSTPRSTLAKLYSGRTLLERPLRSRAQADLANFAVLSGSHLAQTHRRRTLPRLVRESRVPAARLDVRWDTQYYGA